MRSFTSELELPRVIFGAGTLGQVRAEVERLGVDTVLGICGAHAEPHLRAVAGRLGDRLVGRVDGVVQHVPVELVERTTRRAAAVRAEALLVIGGGSATGLAKAVSRTLGLPILAVPTTYAGSEMTPIWGITQAGHKSTGRDPRVLPRTVVYDPALTTSLPAEASAASGMNALAHCVEATYAPEVSPITLWAALEGVRALSDALPRCVAGPADLEARADALYGAWLGGVALGNAPMGLHHKACHVLGGRYDLPHGPTHSALLPYVAAAVAPAVPHARSELAGALGVPDPALGLWDLARRIGAPTSLAEIGFAADQIDAAAEEIARVAPASPFRPTLDAVRRLLAAAFAGEPPRLVRQGEPQPADVEEVIP